MKPSNVKTKVFVGSVDSKTSFAFSQAFSNAECGNVLFISKNPIGELPNTVGFSVPPDKNILRRITFTYPSSWNEIISKCCLIHTWKTTPQTIVVDGLEEYFDFDCDSPISKPALLCAALLSAAGSCARIADSTCSIIITIGKECYNLHFNVISTLINTYFYGDVVTEMQEGSHIEF